MARDITLRGHDYRYAAEQAVMAFLPDFGGEGDRLLSSFSGGVASARMEYRGKVYEGHAVAASVPEGERERVKLEQRLIRESIFEAVLPALPKAPPWGSLTGVRPGKLAARYMDLHGRDMEETAKWLVSEYRISPARAALCARVSEAGLKVRDRLAPEDIILYVGIPFCPTRCAYCSFVSHSVEKSLALVEPYVEALCREMADAGALLRETGLRVRAVYWGGGTPTTLSPEQLRRAMGCLGEHIDLSDNLEYTVEAGRPDTVTAEKLLALRDGGATRLSINPQTMEDAVLAAIGRRHTAADIEAAYALCREVFPEARVNMDLISGLPGDSAEGFRRSLERVLQMAPENVTVHTLTRKRGSDMNESALSGLPGETVGEMVDYSLRRLPEMGYAPYYLYRQKFSVGGYENVGWAWAGTECLYNIAMMEELCSVLSLGAGGATKRLLPGGKILRCFNKKYPREYLASLSAAKEEKRRLFLGEKGVFG